MYPAFLIFRGRRSNRSSAAAPSPRVTSRHHIRRASQRRWRPLSHDDLLRQAYAPLAIEPIDCWGPALGYLDIDSDARLPSLPLYCFLEGNLRRTRSESPWSAAPLAGWAARPQLRRRRSRAVSNPAASGPKFLHRKHQVLHRSKSPSGAHN